VVSARWLFTFHGRLGRGYWWLAFLVQIILIMAASAVAGLIATGGQPETVPPRDTAPPSTILVMIGALVVTTWISLATSAKRLHDLGFSGWWILPLYAASMAGSGLSSALPPGSSLAGLALTAVALALTFGPILFLGAVPGQQGENRFGPDMRGGAAGKSPFGQDTGTSGAAPSGRVESFSDELRELQRLRDEGVISQDEFDRKKKQILGI